MTVSSQVKQTLASLKSVKASLENFSLISQTDQAKKIFSENVESANKIIQNLESRVKELEMEEPEYKGL